MILSVGQLKIKKKIDNFIQENAIKNFVFMMT
jgi:hypothetical protein